MRRKLEQAGVELRSVTQPIDEGSSSATIMRGMITLFDQYQSEETAKHVTRTMLANARDGFWNGSSAHPSYRTVEVAKMGREPRRSPKST